MAPWDVTPRCPFSFSPVCYRSVFQRLPGDPGGKTLPQVLWELRGVSATGWKLGDDAVVVTGGLCLQTPGSGLGVLEEPLGGPCDREAPGNISPCQGLFQILALPSFSPLFNLFFFPLMENHTVEPALSKPGFPAAPWLGRDASPRELPIRLCQAVSPERGLEPLQFKVD